MTTPSNRTICVYAWRFSRLTPRASCATQAFVSSTPTGSLVPCSSARPSVSRQTILPKDSPGFSFMPSGASRSLVSRCRSVLGNIPPLGDFGHADGVFLARLSLCGQFLEVPEPLLNMRDHADQSTTVFGGYGTIDYQAWSVWYNPKLAGRRLMPYWRMLTEYARTIALQRNVAPGARLRCARALGVWSWRSRRKLARDVVIVVRSILGERRRSTAGDTPSRA